MREGKGRMERDEGRGRKLEGRSKEAKRGGEAKG
jgi:hypothetical protein